MLCRYSRVEGTLIRLEQGTFDVQIKNIQKGHIDRLIRAGTKHLSCIEEMASGNRNGMDGQHGGPVLDSESRKSWKVFVVNRVRKMAKITEELGIQWKYCPTERNLADIGSRGASLKKMENCEWYEGPQRLLRKEDWPEQPSISCSSKSQEE